MFFGKKYANSLSLKILTGVLLISSVATLIITTAQLLYDFKQDLNSVEKTLEDIKNSYAPNIAQSMWDFNDDQLQVETSGLLKLPNIAHVEIEAEGKKTFELGPMPDGRIITRQIELQHMNKNESVNLGTLTIIVSLAGVLDKLYAHIAIVFILQMLKTFLVSILIIIFIQRILVRPLLKMDNYLRHFEIGTNETQLEVDRRQAFCANSRDELDSLIGSVNKMIRHMRHQFIELKVLNESLEEKVKKRTQELEQERLKITDSARLASLGEMAGGIAHEINNPLQIIYHNATFLLRLIETKMDPELAAKKVNKITSTVERISKIVKGLSLFSRDGSNDPFVPTMVSAIIEDTLGVCREKMKVNDVELVLENEAPSAAIECKETQISQVLLNFLNNSYDAIQNQAVKWIKIKVQDFAEEIEISVTDCGPGIEPSLARKIFNPFFTTKEIGKGTGLGLSISKGIVESHNGKVWVDASCPNTRFVLRLPKIQRQLKAEFKTSG